MKTKNLSNITQKWVTLLSGFSSDYSAKLSASELARKSKIPQQTASRYLTNLVEFNLINYTKQGKNKLFYFESKQTTKIIWGIIESQKALEFQLKNKKIAIIVNELLDYCDSVIVFGSYSSEKYHSDSDLDLVILKPKNKDKLKKIIAQQIIKINEHYSNYKEFEKTLRDKNPLAIEILGNHILFGDISKIINICPD